MSAAVLIVGLIAWATLLGWFFGWHLPDREASTRRKRHGGTLPRATFENFREPFDRERLPDSGLTTEQLDDWPVLDREPRA